MENVAKPLILEIDEAKQETSREINNILKKHNLPCYLYENIIEDIHRQISTLAQNELGSVRTEYEKDCANAKLKESKETKPNE